jgi:undecaprenyl-diphosphatase
VNRNAWIAGLLAWDEKALGRIHRWPRRNALVKASRAVTQLGDASSWIAFGTVAVLTGGREGQRLAVRGTAAVLAAALVSGVLKRLLNRPRPRERVAGVDPIVADPDEFSFPSGHTAAAVAGATAWAGTPLGVAAAPFAAATALSRVYLGAHYPLDVAVGAMIGLGTGLAARLIPLEDT